MTIAQVSEKYGLSADTLRYYERVKILPPVHRNKSGIRDYTESDCKWVGFIKCMRSAGLSIEALIEYVELFQQGEDTMDARKALLIEQRRQLREKINDMQNTLAILDKKINGYEDLMLKCERQLEHFEEEK